MKPVLQSLAQMWRNNWGFAVNMSVSVSMTELNLVVFFPPIGPAGHNSKGFKAFMTCQMAKMTSLLWNYPTLYAVISLVQNFSFGSENKNICILVVKIGLQKSFFFCWSSWFNREHQLRGSSQQDVWVKPRERKVHVWCRHASLWNLWSKFHIDL